MCEQALVSTDPVVTSLGNFQQAYVYSTKSGDCFAFLSNFDSKSSARVRFNNMHYNSPPWSVSVLPDCRHAVFNTAKDIEESKPSEEILPKQSAESVVVTADKVTVLPTSVVTEDSVSVVINNEANTREPISRSNSLKDNQKKPEKRPII
ncbi:hypothetical protein KIW84_055136 [Lathyrus oleraceus]|uniref:Beta-galactosidase beta-sandwich domain-containing protein n=1 Tax=Pisum sativum TaxID=3888 RepID=A0A9D4WXH9_PEA|nr:hypothetical protein KIW84_055136 [Pisum sativum]